MGGASSRARPKLGPNSVGAEEEEEQKLAVDKNNSTTTTTTASDTLPPSGTVLSSFTLEGVAELISKRRIQKSSVIVLVGAGMSTSAGLPDFRSPDKGLYASLAKFQLAQPEDVFKISYFRNNPAPFYELTRSLLAKNFQPTLAHYFVRLLDEQGYLMRCYSQNVDCLETLSGLSREKLCLAHGSFELAHCLRCNAEYKLHWVRQVVARGEIPHCTSTRDCRGLVKPDVKLFGERLDGRFFRLVKQDFPRCQLLIIVGSSLSVMPFAQLVQRVPARCPRLLINRGAKGGGRGQRPLWRLLFRPNNGLMFERRGNVRDVAFLGDCDEACERLAAQLGWRDQLLELAERRRKQLELEWASQAAEEEEEERVSDQIVAQ